MDGDPISLKAKSRRTKDYKETECTLPGFTQVSVPISSCESLTFSCLRAFFFFYSLIVGR